MLDFIKDQEIKKLSLLFINACLLGFGLSITILCINFVQFDFIVPRKWLQYGQLCFGMYLVHLSLIGIVNSFKNKRWIEVIYVLQGLFLCIMMMLLGIGAYTKFSDLKDSSNCKSLGPLNDAQFIIDESFAMLCSDNCNCNIQEGWLQLYLNERYQTTYEVNKTIAVTNIQSCQYFNQSFDYDERLLKSLRFLEQKYECSGICTQLPLYLFSNINSGTAPKSSCMTIIQNKSREMAQIFTGLSLISSILILISLIEIMVLFILEKCENRKSVIVKSKVFKKENPEKEKIIKKQLFESSEKQQNLQAIDIDD